MSIDKTLHSLLVTNLKFEEIMETSPCCNGQIRVAECARIRCLPALFRRAPDRQKRTWSLSAFCLFVTSIIGTSAAWPQLLNVPTLSVSSTGDDRGDGSEGSPLATIQAAADRAEPGTAVLVKAGHYHENVEVKNSGTEDQPIWFVSADGPGQATIVPVNQYKATIVGRGTDNIVIRDFAIEGADHRNGIEFTQAGHDYHNWVDNLVIEGNHIYGSGIDGIKLAQARNVDVIGNIVSGGREEGVDLTTVMNTRIINNEIRDLDGRSGITAKGGSTNIEIKGNYIHDVGADAVIVGGWTDSDLLDELSLTYQASQVTVEGNRIENIEKRSINFLGGQDSVVKDNFFDPQNDYFTAVNVQVGRWGLVSKNNEISDNVITRENWLHVHSGNEQGLVTDGNVVGGTWAKPVGLDAYQPSPITWLRKEKHSPDMWK